MTTFNWNAVDTNGGSTFMPPGVHYMHLADVQVMQPKDGGPEVTKIEVGTGRYVMWKLIWFPRDPQLAGRQFWDYLPFNADKPGSIKHTKAVLMRLGIEDLDGDQFPDPQRIIGVVARVSLAEKDFVSNDGVNRKRTVGNGYMPYDQVTKADSAKALDFGTPAGFGGDQG